MTSHPRWFRSSLRGRRGFAGLVGILVVISGLALPVLQGGQAIAAPSARSSLHHYVSPVAPSSFDGNVRDLPPVPSGPLADVELIGPTPTKTPANGSGSGPVSAAVAPNMPALAQSFDGLNFAGACTGGACGAGWPPDTVGDVGPSNYIEAVNTAVGIYSKTGTQQAAFTFNSLWSGAGTGTSCDTSNEGDPTVVYDPMADRWFVADFSWTDIDVGPYYECVAVSKTGNPVTGGWWLYGIRADDASHNWLPDYPKMGIWPDGLYMSANMFDCISSCGSSSTYQGVRVYAFNRTVMEAGLPLQEIFNDLSTTYFSLLPSNLRGAAPPVGSPNYFVSESGTAFAFDVFKFHVDWVTPLSSTFTGPTAVSQTSYDFTGGDIVPQPGTTNKLDSLIDRLMMQAQYRNISGTESLWVTHTVRSPTSAPAGIQWAQIDVTGGTVATTPVQQQIFTNGADGLWRWMPSLAVDRSGNMAVGYSVSGSSAPNYPSIDYAGRLVSDPLNTLAQGEATLQAGAGSQTNNCGGAPCHRWGDYTSMSVDPNDDCTFWYVGEYYDSTAHGTAGDWHTRIGSFAFPACTSTPPDTTITSGPSGPTNDPTPTFSFTSTELGSTFECRVDADLFAACTTPFTTAALADGPHTFEVQATDAASNVDPTPASRSFTVDTAPPDTTITGGPSGTTADNTPTFDFTSTEPGSTFECRVDADPFAACTTPFTTATLADGPHTFEVQATDAASNVDPTPASRSFTVDTGGGGGPPPPPPPSSPSADLSVTKTAAPNPAGAGDTVVFTLTVRNSGPNDATGVTLTDTLPSGEIFVSASAGCSNVSATVTCSMGAMANGAVATRTITVTAPTTAGVYRNLAKVIGAQADPNAGNNSAFVDLLVGVTASDTSLTLRGIRHEDQGFVKFRGQLTADDPSVCDVGGQTIALFKATTISRAGIMVATTTTHPDGRFSFQVSPHLTLFWHAVFTGTAACNASGSAHIKVRRL